MKISFELPSIKKIVLWILLLAILFPWIAILLRLYILKSVMDVFDRLLGKNTNKEIEPPKNNGIFY